MSPFSKVVQWYLRGDPPYGHVEVKGLVWEGQNHRGQGVVHNADQRLHMVMGASRNYGYRDEPRHEKWVPRLPTK
jgi:hypothetical protein